MKQAPQGYEIKDTPQRTTSPALVMKSCLAAGVLLACIIGSSYFYNKILIPTQHGDVLTQAQIQERLLAFDALNPIQLEIVQEKEVKDALDGMGLSATDREALEKQMKPAVQPVSNTGNPYKLAWITLWDTDAEDGDVVRIDSHGYSRTVVLTKAPLTFAIPVPADGVVSVTGIKDGDGGGITVGLASGTTKAIFPVMSEGQVLGLKVGLQ